MENENASSAKFLQSPSLQGTPAYRRNPRESKKCYKPTSTRLPFLFFVLIIALGLIALVEIACHQYPVEDNSSILGLNLTRRAPFNGPDDEVQNGSGFSFENIDIRNLGTIQNEITQSSAYAPPTPATSVPASSAAGPPLNVSPTSAPSESAYGPPLNYRPSTAFNPDFTLKTAYAPPDSTAPPTTQLLTLTTTPGAYDPTQSTMVEAASSYDPTAPPVPPMPTEGDYNPTGPLPPPASSGLPPAGGATTEPQLPTRTTIPGEYNQPSLPTGSAGHPGGVTTTDSADQVSAAVSVDTAYNPPSEAGVPVLQTETANNPTTAPLFGTPVTGYNPQSAIPGQQTGSNPPGALPGQQTGSNPQVSGPGNNEDSKVTSLVPVSTYTTGGYVVVEMGTTTMPSYVPISTYTTSGYAIVVMGTQPPTSLVPVSTMTSDGVAVVVLGHPTSNPTGTALPQSGASDSVVVEPVTTTSGSMVYTYMTTMTIHGTKATGTGATDAQATVGGTNQKTSCSGTSAEAIANYKFTPMNYFTAAYVPTLVAVAFRILWTLVYNNARLMEPFYRLASPAGASGKHFLQMLYLSMDDFIPEPFPSLLSGHSYMLLVSSIAALTQLLTPLCAEFLTVDMTHGVIFGDGSDPNHPCAAQVVLRYLPARILQGILGAIALAIILTMILSWNRPSGVYSDPSSIAVMASLLHHPEVVDQFKALARHAGDEEMTRIASEQAYKLGHYPTADGLKYGVFPVLQMTKTGIRTSNTYTPVLNPGSGAASQKVSPWFWRHTWRTVGDCFLGFLLFGVLGVVVAYYKDSADDGFNRFFSSQSFGPKFILVLASGVIVSQWKRIEREVRTLQPYRQLASHSASSPTHTILQVTTATPWTTFPIALIQREFFTALVSLCYLLSEILVIVVATVPFTASEYWIEYLSGTYICFSILGLQILTFAAVILWWRRTGPRLERDPDTTLGVWTLLASGGLREDFEDMGTAGRKELVANVKGWRKRYWLGWSGGTRGKAGDLPLGIYDDMVMFANDKNDSYVRSKVSSRDRDRNRDLSRFSESDSGSSRYEAI